MKKYIHSTHVKNSKIIFIHNFDDVIHNIHRCIAFAFKSEDMIKEKKPTLKYDMAKV